MESTYHISSVRNIPQRNLILAPTIMHNRGSSRNHDTILMRSQPLITISPPREAVLRLIVQSSKLILVLGALVRILSASTADGLQSRVRVDVDHVARSAVAS